MTLQQNKKIFCLMGPTASGKTDLAVQLIQQFPMEIISVDSAMVYREMDIGTAKPAADILKEAPHRLIDIRDPSEPYSAAQFREDALREMEDVFAKEKMPLLVGGTMLYFHALQKGLSELPSANAELRAKISAEAEAQGWPAMHERLAKIDPAAAQRIHPHDSQRLQRALEVYELSGKNLSTWQQENRTLPGHYEIINLALFPQDRRELHERIALRFKKMLTTGLIDEVEKLVARGDLNLTMPSIRSVGYRQVWEYLLGNFSYDEMQEKGIIATRQLAKRQMTWLRSWPDVMCFDNENEKLIESVKRKI